MPAPPTPQFWGTGWRNASRAGRWLRIAVGNAYQVAQNWGVGGTAALALFACLCLPAQCAPKAILFLSSAPTVRDVFAADAPALQSLITHGGVAVMTPGPPGVQALYTCGANGYVTYRQHYNGDTGDVTDEARVNGAPLLRGDPGRFGYLATKLAPFGKIVPVGGSGAMAFVYTGSLFFPGGPTETGMWQGNLSSAMPGRFARSVRAAAQHASVVAVDPIDPLNPNYLTQAETLVRLAEEDRVLASVRKDILGAPVVAVGVGGSMWIAVSNLQGRLTSDTTRTQGIVSNLDVAPTVIAMVTGQAPADTVGHVIQSGGREGFQHSVPKPVAATIRLQDALGVLAQAMDTTNYSLAFGTILLIISGTVLCGLRGKTKAKRFVQRALLVAAAAPIAVAVSAWRQPETQAIFYALSIAVTLALITAFILLGRALSASREDITLAILEMALGALCAFVIADVARHGMPLKLSPLSNFYQTGIRFYGLGNEYAAIFIAAEVLVALVALQCSGAEAPAMGVLTGLGAWYTGCALFVGWPTLGANMGGMIAAFATGGMAWTLVARGRLRAAWLWPLIAAVLCLGMVVWTDVHTAHPTHIGTFVSGAARHSGGGILLTKLAINMRLLGQPAAWAIYSLGLLTGWVWLRPLRPVLNRVRSTYPWLAPGFIATAFGGIVAMLVNDTGIVMLGLMAGVSAVAGMMLALEPPALKVVQGVPKGQHGL